MFKGAVLRYLLSDALSLIGNSIAGVVLPLVLLARTGDVLAAGSLALICAVPQFVCGVVGGAVLDRVPDDRRGSAMGTLNALYLVVAPAGAFVGSVLISTAQIGGAGLVLTGAWVVVTALALTARPLRHLDARIG